MAQSVAQKLRIKEGMTLLTLHPPVNFEQQVQPLPANVTITSSAKDFHQLHWFVRNKAQLDREVTKVLKLIRYDVLCWVYFPKGSSNIQIDLTRDKGWESLRNHEELHWLTLVSFDETWSVFGFRLKPAIDKKTPSPAVREIFNYIDPVNKIVILPADLSAAFKNSKTAHDFFQTLSFTNKKEYVEWIVTAKREETRKQRIEGTIDRLEKQWKNPRNL